MDLKYEDPSSGDMPIELIEEALQHGKATCVAFNRRGTLLAAGTAAGSVQVWDFQTRSVARELVSDSAEESAAILSVAWSRDGRKLISSAADGSLTVWDVAEADDVFRHTFDAPIHRAQFNPTNASLALVCPSDDGPMTFALGRGRKRIPLPQMPGGIDVPSLVCRIPSEGLDTSATRAPAYALYSRSGAHVFVGNVRGVVTVVETATMDIVQACKVPDATLIKRMELSADGRRLLVVSSAKAMHAYDVDEGGRAGAGAAPPGVSSARAVLTPAGSFANHASRGQWSAGAFTRDGERVIGASAGGAHELHVWRRSDGVVERVGSGAAEAKGIAQLEAHPTRPVCVALGSNGVMYAWSKSHDECWSAFAPDFVELAENEEYVEREDEFDKTKRDAEDPSGNVAKAIAAPDVVARGAAAEAARSVAEAEEAVRAELEAMDKAEREEAERAEREAKNAEGREGEDANLAQQPRDAPQATAPAPPEPAPEASAPEASAPEASAPEASAPETSAEKKEERPDTAIVVAEPTDEERALVAAAAAEAAKAAATEKSKEEYRQFVILSHEQVSALAEKLRGARSEAAAAAAAAAEAASLEKSAAIVAAARERGARRAEEEAAAERAAATAEDADVDVLTAEPGYLTEEEAGEDCMHHLPLEIEPDPRAAEIVQTRLDRWAKRAERAAAQGNGEPDAAGGEKRKRESDEDEDDEEEDEKEEDEEEEENVDDEENDDDDEEDENNDDDDEEEDDGVDVAMEDAA